MKLLALRPGMKTTIPGIDQRKRMDETRKNIEKLFEGQPPWTVEELKEASKLKLHKK